MLQDLESVPKNFPKLVDNAWLVTRVFEHSPAYQLGLRPGWRLLTVDRAAPDERVLSNARREGSDELLFCDVDLNRVAYLNNTAWPFGMTLAPWPGTRFAQKIANADFDPEGLTMLWSNGLETALAAVEVPLQRYLSRMAYGFWGRLTGRLAPLTDLVRHPDYVALNIFALTKVLTGKIEEAEFVLAAARQSRADAAQASYSTIDLSMDHYTQSRIHDARGESERALEAARSAKELAPDIPEVEKWLARLEERSPVTTPPDWVGKSFPVEYVLQANDPVGEVVSPVVRVGFREIVDTLRDGEFLLIMVLGDYRSNYYYNLDMERVAELKRAFPDVLREVHVITNGDYALDVSHRRQSEGVCRNLNLPFVILWDEGAETSNSIDSDGFPARFIVDRNGRVLATERLMEEEGFWAAVGRERAGG